MQPCPFCKTDDCRRVMIAKSYPILHCSSCELVFTGVGEEFDPSSIYTEEFWHSDNNGIGYRDYFARQDSVLRKCKSRLKKICAFTAKKSGTLLDFGCGPGYFLKVAEDQGWEVFGVDISHYAVEYAQKSLGVKNVHCGTMPPEEWGNNRYDVLTLWAVIEHVPNPWSLLKTLTDSLKPDGLVCLMTGNWNSIAAKRLKQNWRLMTPPGHLYFFSRKTMCNLLKCCDLRMVKYRTNDDFGGSRNSLLRKNPLKKFLRFLSLGDIMTVYARKAAATARK